MTAFLEAFVKALQVQDRSSRTLSAYDGDARGVFEWLFERLGKAVWRSPPSTCSLTAITSATWAASPAPSTANWPPCASSSPGSQRR